MDDRVNQEVKSPKGRALTRNHKYAILSHVLFILAVLVIMPFILGVVYSSATVWVVNYYATIYSSAQMIYNFLISLIKGTIVFVIIPLIIFGLIYFRNEIIRRVYPARFPMK